MAAGMVRKPLVNMDHKFARDQATPDFVSFQELFRQAEGNECSMSLIATEVKDIEVPIDERRGAQYDENESKKLLKLPVRTILPISYPPTESGIFRMEKRIHRNPKKRSFEAHDSQLERSLDSLSSNISLKYPSVFRQWESLICWDDVPDELGSMSRENVNKRLRRLVPKNKYVSSGEWVDGIVWDSDIIYVDGDGHDAEMNENCFSDLVDTSSLWSNPAPSHVDSDDGSCFSEVNDLEDEYSFLRIDGSSKVSSQADKLIDDKTTNEDINESEQSEVGGVLPAPLPMRLSRQQHLEQLEREKTKRLMSLEMFNSKKNATEASEAVASRRKRTTAADEELEHSIYAARHMNTCASLSHLQLKFFHRPTLSRQALSSVLHKKPNIWHINIEKKGKHKLSASQGNLRRNHNSTKQISSAAELTLVEDTAEYICVEYIEEHPNLMMNRGMASKIINYYRPVENQNGNADEDAIESGDQCCVEGREDDPALIGSESNTRIVGRSDNKENTNGRLPRHFRKLKAGPHVSNSFIGGQSSRAATVGDIDVPKLKEGVTEVLEEGDDFPFLGDIKPGAPPQSALHCHLFRAPLFTHEPRPTDFLLVRKSVSGGGFHFVLKKLPVLFTSGQQEPLKEVPTPKRKKAISRFQSNFMMFHLTKYFENHAEINIHNLQKEFKLFWEKYRSDTKKALRRLAVECVSNDDDTVTWVKKPPMTAREIQRASMQNQQIPLAVDDFMEVFSPEDVCIYEVGASAEYRLSLLGIHYFMNQKQLEQVLNRLHKLKKFKISRLRGVKKFLRKVRENLQLKRDMPRSYRLKAVEAKSETSQEEDEKMTRQIQNLNKLQDILQEELKRLKEKIVVVRYIYEVSLLTPWVLTGSFVKNHVEEQQKSPDAIKAVLTGRMASRGGYQKYSGLLRLTGIPGDPSGVGEGYSFLSAVSKKGNVTKKDKDGNASSATIVGTGKDLRILSMKDLETLLIELGTAKEEVKILERWDRVRVIQYAATEAKKLGYSKHLWRYAREEKEGTQNLDEYKETCLEIWNRQLHALRDTTWAEADYIEDEASRECLRRFKRKQRRDLRAARKARAEERQKLVASGEAVEGSGGEDGSNSQESDLSDSNSDDSDFDMDLDSDSDLDTDSDEEENAAQEPNSDAVPVAAVASRRTKKALAKQKKEQRLQRHEEKQAKDLKFFESLDSSAAVDNPPSSEPSKGSNLPKTREEHEAVWRSIREQGGKVVKRVTRRILADGTEIIEVRFVVNSDEVDRVIQSERVAELRQRRSQGQLTGGESSQFGNEEFGESKGLSKQKKPSHQAVDSYEDEHGDEAGTLTLKMSKILSKAEKHKAARNKRLDSAPEMEFERYQKKAKVNSRLSRGAGAYTQRTLSQQRHPRLPHVLLSANLDDILCSLWNKKISAPFRAPVDTVAYPDYTKFVKRPISLQQIRDKIVDYSYHTVQEFVDDLELMVANCSVYNGKVSPITQHARKLFDEAIKRLAVEGMGQTDYHVEALKRNSYGFYGQENDVKSLFHRIGRSFHDKTSDDLPLAMIPSGDSGINSASGDETHSYSNAYNGISDPKAQGNAPSGIVSAADTHNSSVPVESLENIGGAMLEEEQSRPVETEADDEEEEGEEEVLEEG